MTLPSDAARAADSKNTNIARMIEGFADLSGAWGGI